MKRNIFIILITALYFASVVIGIIIVIKTPKAKKVIAPQLPTIKRIELPFQESIAIVNIYGIIRISQRPTRFFAYGSETVTQKLRSIIKRADIKAVVLRINSPGGSVAAVQEICSEIKHLRNSGKKVVASFGDVAASGAYYIASACDKIVANPGTLTGSIGVIMEIANVQELFKKIGIKVETIKSNRYKDTGTPFREIGKEEKEMLQKLIDDAYEQFLTAIMEGRKIPREKLLNFADGRIYTGNQAYKLGLVDKLGTDADAIQLAKELANIKGEPKIITEIEPWEKIISLFTPAQSSTTIPELLESRKIRLEYILE